MHRLIIFTIIDLTIIIKLIIVISVTHLAIHRSLVTDLHDNNMCEFDHTFATSMKHNYMEVEHVFTATFLHLTIMIFAMHLTI